MTYFTHEELLTIAEDSELLWTYRERGDASDDEIHTYEDIAEVWEGFFEGEEFDEEDGALVIHFHPHYWYLMPSGGLLWETVEDKVGVFRIYRTKMTKARLLGAYPPMVDDDERPERVDLLLDDE